MGVKTIRSAICDRCGIECSVIETRTVGGGGVYERKEITYNRYHFTEITLSGFDSRFSDIKESKFCLCGKCVSDFSNFLHGDK